MRIGRKTPLSVDSLINVLRGGGRASAPQQERLLPDGQRAKEEGHSVAVGTSGVASSDHARRNRGLWAQEAGTWVVVVAVGDIGGRGEKQRRARASLGDCQLMPHAVTSTQCHELHQDP